MRCCTDGAIDVQTIDTYGRATNEFVSPNILGGLHHGSPDIDVDINIRRAMVKTAEDIRRHKFVGSPTVRINGLDVDRTVRAATQYGFT